MGAVGLAGALRCADLGPTVCACTCMRTETETVNPGTRECYSVGCQAPGMPEKDSKNLRGLQTTLM